MRYQSPFLFSVAFCLIALGAQASVPEYDVKGQCDRIARADGTLSMAMLKTCFEQEQAAYDRIKPLWDALPQTSKEHCQQIGGLSGTGSYILLSGCVQQESAAAAAPKENFEFHR